MITKTKVVWRVNQKFFLGCSSARCGNSDSSCNHYKASGCSSNFSRPWVMCKDDTGMYHCKPHSTTSLAKKDIENFTKSHTFSKGCKHICDYADKPAYKISGNQEVQTYTSAGEIRGHFCSNVQDENKTGEVHSWCNHFGTKSAFFLGCSSARCGNSDSSCNHYKASGCSSNFSRPWVMCKDDTGMYHCKPHSTTSLAKKDIENFTKSHTFSKGCKHICDYADKPAYKISGNQEVQTYTSAGEIRGHFCSNVQDENKTGEVHSWCKRHVTLSMSEAEPQLIPSSRPSAHKLPPREKRLPLTPSTDVDGSPSSEYELPPRERRLPLTPPTDVDGSPSSSIPSPRPSEPQLIPSPRPSEHKLSPRRRTPPLTPSTDVDASPSSSGGGAADVDASPSSSGGGAADVDEASSPPEVKAVLETFQKEASDAEIENEKEANESVSRSMSESSADEQGNIWLLVSLVLVFIVIILIIFMSK